MRSIKALPECVQNSVRSGIVLFDLTRVVEELIFNSLDAAATKVSVAVGVGTCYVKVVDNGSGITRDGLVLLGERYATSKFDQLADMDIATGSFGFRGEALGSISDVSLLEIVTKAPGRPNGYRKVMKGCKCLYLGIDGDRQDVGTTVIVRDLFYNQPVRRKHLQSSPKKVLHSIKECVLRIALVHLKISFKVVDIESEDELLCTFPSPSPLPLLMSGFGIEVSSSLNELDVSDRVLKLSGYISGPCETFSVKDLQYVYINSRFTCKGPIHKLLNQLAATFNSSNLWKANIGPQNGKRRSQPYPAYILNLSCPRSYYDLTFEPSKTSVEFKDWDFILTFIEKAIRHFWTRNLSYDSFTCGADMSEKDDMWKEGDNIVSSEEDMPADYGIARKRCRTQCYQTYVDLPSPQLKILPEESKLMSTCQDSRFLCRESSRNALEIKEHQSEMAFACHTENSFQPCDKSLAQCKETANPENICHLGSPDSNVSSADYFLETKLATKRSNEHIDCTLGPRWYDPSLKVDANMSCGLDCFDIVNNVEEVSKEVKKSFMRSCSFRRSLQPDGDLSATDVGFEYHIDGFRAKKEWLDHDYRVDLGAVDDNNQSIEQWQHEAASFWSPPKLTTRRNKFMGSEFLGMDSVSADCFAEESENPLGSVAQIKKIGSNHRSSNSEWSPLIPNHSLKTKPQDLKNFRHEDVLDGHFKFDRSTKYEYFADREVKDTVSSIDNVQSSSSRSLKGDVFELPGHNFDDVLFPKCYDTFSVETEWFGLDSCGKDMCAVPSHPISSLSCVDEDRDQRARIRYREKMYGCEKKPSRSHSAPPFYRGRKKFVSLNNCSTMEAGKLHYNTNEVVPTLQEIKNLKHRQQSPDAYHLLSKPSSLNDSLHCSRQNMKITPDTSEIQNLKMQTEGQGLHTYKTSSEGFTSKEAEDPLASGLKWRNSCAQTASEDKPHNLHRQDTSILDISSGILHLAGDSLVPKSISKNFLESAKVLQQVDRKFIPVVAGGTLAIIDQHAADERIRLEELRQKVLSGEMKTITYLDAEQELVLPEIGHQLLHNYAEQIHNWGWLCSINSQNSRSFKRNLNLLHSQPSVATLLAVPCILGVDLTDVDLLEFLQQLADTDGSSAIPPSVLRVLNFKACRGAIMFGDKLLPSECSLIVEELKRTSLCFQCAHGRPTTVPLVNIEMLHKQIANLGLWNGGTSQLWHGLHRHELSLDRAALRLSSAEGRC